MQNIESSPGPGSNFRDFSEEIYPYLPGSKETVFEPVLTQEETDWILDALTNWQNAELHHDCNRKEYKRYLKKTTGIDPKNPNLPVALRSNTQKGLAHTLLAYQGLTEKESHLMPLGDLRSIVAHAHKLYESNSHPWFDLATTSDVTSKSGHDVTQKISAPLFKDKDCPTFGDFLIKVLPTIIRLRREDPLAAIKIFPQSKNVETFNLSIKTNLDGTKVWIFEWFPGAYTPRDGEDAGHKRVIKNRTLSKEQRIVRVTIKFDKHGNAICGLKSQKDSEGNDLPFRFPAGKVRVQDLFTKAEVVGNHDDMVPSNNPLIFLQYLSTNKKVQNLISRFEKVHKQLGYADLVLSGMIGPHTLFGMDLDFDTPQEFQSDAEYINSCLSRNYSPEISYHHLHKGLCTAPILHELDLTTIDEFYLRLEEIFSIAHEGYLDKQQIEMLAKQLGLLTNSDGDILSSDILSYTPLSHVNPEALLKSLTSREIMILKSMIARIQVEKSQNEAQDRQNSQDNKRKRDVPRDIANYVLNSKPVITPQSHEGPRLKSRRSELRHHGLIKDEVTVANL